MANSRIDPAILAHLEWLGYVKPTGLVVSAPALIRAGVILEQRDTAGHADLIECVEHHADFARLAKQVLGWTFSPKFFAGSEESPIPDELRLHLPEAGETLKPDYAVREREPRDGQAWQLLVQIVPNGQNHDQVTGGKGRLEATPTDRMLRLLRHTGAPAGLLYNGDSLRLISAPGDETSGFLDFRLADMALTAGRPICAAMRMLLHQKRLLTVPKKERLTALLEDSRKYQNQVSERLAEQVLHALYELVRGFQSAHDASHGRLLADALATDPDDVYHGLLTVILRVVFLLYAEEREMMPDDAAFTRFYSVGGLHDRLREDASLYPDTMDQRFGAWAQLLVLFRMVYDGAEAGALRIPPRHGELFDPRRYPFLEGNDEGVIPLVPDGTIYRALEKLLVLDGERISYRALDVEQIGSVYETTMGFRMEIATGRSVEVKAAKRHGAPTTVDLDALLALPNSKRAKALQDQTDRKITDRVQKAVEAAGNLDELHAALHPVLDLAAAPDIAAKGAMVLQPSEERRRSGSHYTPRSLTEPIVRTTLEPVIAPLRGSNGEPPKPEQILELKVCDPAMGSGAFLVETCRQLGAALVESWRAHGETPPIPPDEDDLRYAQRLVAQKCVYGVDKNPMAVELAKVSLWLLTLAKDHPLTFLDHNLKCGDSLVGLDREQVAGLHWDTKGQLKLVDKELPDRLQRLRERREAIARATEESHDQLNDILTLAERDTADLRLVADAVVAAFFAGANAREREAARDGIAAWGKTLFAKGAGRTELGERVEALHGGERPLRPFHWELEFPEVFLRKNVGFDAIVGNPPFAGKNTVGAVRPGYLDWLKELHPESHGNADLVAHFFRRAFNLLRRGGAFGLLATNTIAQGDTRSSGLRYLAKHGGAIFSARRRYKWPGQAAVVVSVVHVFKGTFEGRPSLDGKPAERISAFLFHRGGDDDPVRLAANAGKSFQGSIVLGMGFTFDDTDAKGLATPLAEMRRLIAENPSNADVIFPYIGGEEVNTSPTHAHHRYVIDFYDRPLSECRRRWPELMAIVERKVKPDRDVQNRQALREFWWQYAEKRPGLHAAIARLDRVLAISSVGQYPSLAFLPAKTVFSHALIVFPLPTHAAFCALQSRPHEFWTRFFGSSLEDRLRYTPSDCFETFPFPENWETDPVLEAAGKALYEFRAGLMVRNGEGLTKTYNRFHNPEESDPDIERLRELHTAIDRAVLDVYGWTDVPTDCDFFLDYEDEEDDDSSRRRKKPWRYRWPDEVRDDVLARLLELNARRAEEESLKGKPTGPAASKRRLPSQTETLPME